MYTREKLVVDLNWGRLGVDLPVLVEKINIPYDYLSGFVRSDIPEIINRCVRPNLQNLVREGKEPKLMVESIVAEKERMSPDKMSVREYLYETIQINKEKINCQDYIANLIKAFLYKKIDETDFIASAMTVLRINDRIEATFFASGSFVKQYATKCIEDLSPFTTDENMDLFLTTGIPSGYVLYDLDLMECLALEGEDQQIKLDILRRRYFNNDELYLNKIFKQAQERTKRLFNTQKKRSEELELIVESRNVLVSRWVRKVNLLSDSKIKSAEYLDELLLLDNCFDKIFERKCCFLHDLFLKICLVDILNDRKPLELTIQNIDEKIKDALFINNEELSKLVEQYESNTNRSTLSTAV